MSYIRIKLKDNENYEYFDTAIDFAKRYRALQSQKADVESVDKIIANFCYSQNDIGTRELLRQGEPLKKGYLLITTRGKDTLYLAGDSLTRHRNRARVYSESEAKSFTNKNRIGLKYHSEPVENSGYTFTG